MEKNTWNTVERWLILEIQPYFLEIILEVENLLLSNLSKVREVLDDFVGEQSQNLPKSHVF